MTTVPPAPSIAASTSSASRPGASRSSIAELGAGRLRDRGRRLSRAQQRAREHERPAPRGEPLARFARLLATALALSGRSASGSPGFGVGMADEDEAHAG